MRALLAACLLAQLTSVRLQATETRDVYTYYEETKVKARDGELEAVAVWNLSWTRAGWTTHLLTLEDARRHPDFARLRERFALLPTVNSPAYELSCFTRWLAMAQTEGGVLSDYDVLNVGWLAPQPLPAKLTTLERHVPSVALGSKAEFQRALALFAAFERPLGDSGRLYSRKGRPHVSDQNLLRAASERGDFARQHTVFTYRAFGSENASLLHLNHAAVLTRGAGLGRNELMGVVLRQQTQPSAAELAQEAARAAEGPTGGAAYPLACTVNMSALPPREAKFFANLYKGPPGFTAAVCGQPITGRSCYGEGEGRVCLPGFVGIGFEKAGTTKVFDLLKAHPGVCVTQRKEAMLMIDVRSWPAMLREQFSGSRGDCLHGEFTPFYATPFRPAALADYLKVLQHLLPPDTRLVAAVRDPVRRAYSHYKYHLERGFDCEDKLRANAPCFPKFFTNGTFRNAVCYALNQLGGEQYLEALAGMVAATPYPFTAVNRTIQYPHWDLLSPGFYAHMLRPWSAVVGRERLFVFQMEELEEDPLAVLRRAYDFLRLPPFDLAGAVGNATLFSRARNSLGSRLDVGDRKLVNFLYALYANSTQLTNLLYGTSLTSVPFNRRALNASRICRHFRKRYTGPYH